MGKRGRTIPLSILGAWWVRLARKVINSDPRDLRTLGKDLAKHVRGKSKFDHSILSKFASGAVSPTTGLQVDPTFDLVEALCMEFTRLPKPFFFARTYEEAVHLGATSERYDGLQSDFDDDEAASAVVPLPAARSRRKLNPPSSTHATTAKRRTRSA